MAIIGNRDKRYTNTYNEQDSELDRPSVTEDRVLSLLSWVVYVVASVIIGLILIRFILLILAANPQNAFANFIYNVSEPLVAPFSNLFNYGDILAGQSRIELSSLLAIFVYGIIAYVLIRILNSRRVY